MKIANAEEVASVWLELCNNADLSGIIIRHGEKRQDHGTFAGLSERGFRQRDAFFEVLRGSGVLGVLTERGVRLASSNPLRNTQTFEPLMVFFLTDLILTANLRFPDLDADLEAAREVAAEHGINIKQAIRALEQYGRTRKGEHPNQYCARIRTGVIEQVERTPPGQVLLLSGNSPVFNEAAFDLPGELGELEAAFMARGGWPCRLLNRIKPFFED